VLRRYPLLIFAVPAAVALILALETTHASELHSIAVRSSWGLGVVLVLGALGAPRVYEAARWRRSGINQIDTMTGEQFEQRLNALFREYGFNVSMTRATGDFGADLVLERDGTRTVVQAKRWDDSVGIEAVYEVVGAKAHYRASEAAVVTNSLFTPAAIELANDNGVALIERGELVNMLAGQAVNDSTYLGADLAMRQIASGTRVAFTYTFALLALVSIMLVAFIANIMGHPVATREHLTRLRHTLGTYALYSAGKRGIVSALRR